MSSHKAVTFDGDHQITRHRFRVAGSKPASATVSTKRPERVDEVRYCECGTRLSAYNVGDACWAHTGPMFRRVRGASNRPRTSG